MWKVLEAFYRQLWYLTGEMIPLALLCSSLPTSEREDLARALHGITRGMPRVGKPLFPTITVLLKPYPTRPIMDNFVTNNSWAIFNRLGLGGTNVRYKKLDKKK